MLSTQVGLKKVNVFSARSSWMLAAFAISGFLTTSYTLNHFYTAGAYMLDSGWFAHLSTNSVKIPPDNPASLGGTYFSTHFSPIFIIYSALFKIFALLKLVKYSPSWFSLTQGFWVGLTAASTFSLLTIPARPNRSKYVLALPLSVLLSFNGVYLGCIAFPHFEIAIPSLLVAFFALFAENHSRIALASILLGLLVREDAGLHYAILFLLLWLYSIGKSKEYLNVRAVFWLRLALVCLAYSMLAIMCQKIFYGLGDDALRRVYLGDPMYGHVSINFLLRRVAFLLTERLYIVVPICVLLVYALRQKKLLLLIGVIATIPWFIFSLFALSDDAGTLRSYYSFPIATALLWPVISFGISPIPNNIAFDNKSNANLVLNRTAIFSVAISSAILFSGSEGNHDNTPWDRIYPHWIGKASRTMNALKNFIDSSNSKILFDDAPASLLTGTIGKGQWKYQFRFTDQQLYDAGIVVYQPKTGFASEIIKLARQSGMIHFCLIKDTKLVAISRNPPKVGCQNYKLTANLALAMSDPLFDMLPGWSHLEGVGRWTDGTFVSLPPIKIPSKSKLCITGSGYLPRKSNMIRVTLYTTQFKTRSAFFKYNESGKICFVNNPTKRDLSSSEYLDYLVINGHSSPKAQGQSSDPRNLGIFVKNIFIEVPQ
jgi:hypothetical protein